MADGFTDALGGPDGTADPAVLMPVLPVYSDALSAPMPDAMVAVPPVDPNAILAAARWAAVPTPAQARMAAQQATDRRAVPGRAGRSTSAPVPSTGPPATRRSSQPAVAPHLQAPRRPGTNQVPTASARSGSSAWTGRTASPAEVAGYLRATIAGITNSAKATTQQFQPAAHAPTPPLPRAPRRNKGSSVWAVLVFLIVIAFASGIAQQLLSAISELFNR